jgi:hypothetical protein
MATYSARGNLELTYYTMQGEVAGLAADLRIVANKTLYKQWLTAKI